MQTCENMCQKCRVHCTIPQTIYLPWFLILGSWFPNYISLHLPLRTTGTSRGSDFFKPNHFGSNYALLRTPADSRIRAWEIPPQVSGPAQHQCCMLASTLKHCHSWPTDCDHPTPHTSTSHPYTATRCWTPLCPLCPATPPLPSAPLTLPFRQHCLDEQWSHCYLKVAYCEGCSRGAAEVTLTL